MPAFRQAPAPRGPPVFPRPIINRTRSLTASGLTQRDQMLNHIRTSSFPASTGVIFQFPSPPTDKSYSNLSIVFNRSRNGLVPKDMRLNHVQPLIAV